MVYELYHNKAAIFLKKSNNNSFSQILRIIRDLKYVCYCTHMHIHNYTTHLTHTRPISTSINGTYCFKKITQVLTEIR